MGIEMVLFNPDRQKGAWDETFSLSEAKEHGVFTKGSADISRPLSAGWMALREDWGLGACM